VGVGRAGVRESAGLKDADSNDVTENEEVGVRE